MPGGLRIWGKVLKMVVRAEILTTGPGGRKGQNCLDQDELEEWSWTFVDCNEESFCSRCNAISPIRSFWELLDNRLIWALLMCFMSSRKSVCKVQSIPIPRPPPYCDGPRCFLYGRLCCMGC
jgi:hypothetical protein